MKEHSRTKDTADAKECGGPDHAVSVKECGGPDHAVSVKECGGPDHAVSAKECGGPDYTDNMKELFHEKVSGLGSFYCREDVEAALKAVKRAERNAVDALASRKRDLEVICKAVGLDAKQLLKKPALLETIPTREALKEELMTVFHDVYTSFPESADYMDRLVRRLAPEYREDTVRTAILKKFVLGGGFEWKTSKAIIAWAKAQMSEEEKQEYADCAKEQKLIRAVSKLNDEIFSEEHMQIRLSRLEQLKLMIERLESWKKNLQIISVGDTVREFPGLLVGADTRKALHTFCKKHELQCSGICDVEGMLKTIVEAYANGELPEAEAEKQMESFFDPLEKDLQALLNTLYYFNSNGKAAKMAALYEDNKRDARRKKQKDWELLRLCDDLAAGKFKTNNGKTREFLYYFAIMFDMTVALRDTDKRTPETDIEKNLFEDYYNDNLIRFLREEYGDSKAVSSYEKEPAGDGINYKSFVEAIYLYYLSRRDLKLTRGERIDHAKQMIDKCVREAKKAEDLLTETLPEHTGRYKKMYVAQMLPLEEEELVDFILYNYLVKAPTKTGIRIMISSEKNTASDKVDKLLTDLEETYLGAMNAGNILAWDEDEAIRAAYDYIEDARFENNMMFEWKMADALKVKYAEEEDFIRLVNKLDERLSAELNWIGARKKKFLVYLLYALNHHSSPEAPIKIEELRKIMMKSTDVTTNGPMLTEGSTLLAQMGFDVYRKTDKNGDSLFYLNDRVYEDEALTDIIRRLSGKYRINEPVILQQMEEIIQKRMVRDRRISRSTLIAVYMSYYVTVLSEDEEIESFPDLYERFMSGINQVLREARFQPLSEKNVLDVYVLLSLYFYVAENGK